MGKHCTPAWSCCKAAWISVCKVIADDQQAMLSQLCLFLLSIPILRRKLYEISLRFHQLLSVATIYASFQHLRPPGTLPWYCIVSSGCLLAGTCLSHVVLLMIRDRFFFRGVARAKITHVDGVTRVDITTPIPLRIYGGQYVNIWIPGLSIRSIFQSHPFVVASTDKHEAGVELKLVVKPRRGWTLHLFQRALDLDRRSQSYAVLFSGPHGLPAPVLDYGVVILAASGSGILAQFPYLRRLIRGYDNFTSRTRRIRVVWQLDHIGRQDWSCSQ